MYITRQTCLLDMQFNLDPICHILMYVISYLLNKYWTYSCAPNQVIKWLAFLFGIKQVRNNYHESWITKTCLSFGI